jgi:PAS domain-containing protein
MPKPNGIPAEALVAAMATAGVGCWLWDTETRHLQISENFQTLLGLLPDGLPETPDAWLAWPTLTIASIWSPCLID